MLNCILNNVVTLVFVRIVAINLNKIDLKISVMYINKMPKSNTPGQRAKKSNKAKRTKDLYGNYTNKGVRHLQSIKEKTLEKIVLEKVK